MVIPVSLVLFLVVAILGIALIWFPVTLRWLAIDTLLRPPHMLGDLLHVHGIIRTLRIPTLAFSQPRLVFLVKTIPKNELENFPGKDIFIFILMLCHTVAQVTRSKPSQNICYQWASHEPRPSSKVSL